MRKEKWTRQYTHTKARYNCMYVLCCDSLF